MRCNIRSTSYLRKDLGRIKHKYKNKRTRQIKHLPVFRDKRTDIYDNILYLYNPLKYV